MAEKFSEYRLAAANQLWGQHMWARGYFCCSTGNVTDEMIAEYIAHQQDDRDDDFKVDG
jgi:putative transposase